MHKLTRMAAMLVVLAVAAMLPGAQAMEIPQLPSPHPAGCHGHSRPAAPSPAPVSYQCCVTGHAVALPNASFSLRHAAAQLGKLDDSNRPRLEFVSRLHTARCVVPSMSPPDPAPLRI
jgi:hypothetical protein